MPGGKEQRSHLANIFHGGEKHDDGGNVYVVVLVKILNAPSLGVKAVFKVLQHDCEESVSLKGGLYDAHRAHHPV